MGLEPTQPCGYRLLRPARLPVPPLSRAGEPVQRSTEPPRHAAASCSRRRARRRPRADPPWNSQPGAPEPALTGWAAWSDEQAAIARERYAFHQWRAERDKRENDERLAAKAAAKLADLASHSRLTDPDALAAKRAVIEAALARAKARRGGPEGAA